jgi:hypothetical protein
MTPEDLSDYDAHVLRQNTAYAVAFEEFEASLTPEQRISLGRNGAPDIEDNRAVPTRRVFIGITKDAADSYLASETPDIAAGIDTIKDEMAELGIPKEVIDRFAKWHEARVMKESESSKASLVVKFAGIFLHSSNVRLHAAALAYSADLALVYGMGSMDSWAKQHGLSRQAVSKVANFWRRELGLPGGSHMRDDKTREAYKNAQLNNHWRKKKYENRPVHK